MHRLQTVRAGIIILGDDYLEVDTWDEGTAGGGPCPHGVYIYEALATLSGSDTAYYPNVAEVKLQLASPADDVDYEWTRDILLLDEQRGGKCGPISESDTAQAISLHHTFYKYPSSVRNPDGTYACTYSALDCAPGTTAYCNGGFYAPEWPGICPVGVGVGYIVVLGVCTVGPAEDSSDLPPSKRICT